MPNYHIEYETWNEYDYHVGESFFSLQILPCNDDKQTINHFKFENSISEPEYITKNHYGFRQITFRSLKSFAQLRIHLSCEVHISKINPYDFVPLSIEQETEILNSPEQMIDWGLFLQHSSYTTIKNDRLTPEWLKRDSESVFDFLVRLNGQIHSEFKYIPNVTDVHHSADDTFETKEGVCQDFAHIFLTVARLNKIPCRYVSGYLSQGENFKGDLQMHAWVEALIPNCGWIGFDPTNNILRDHHYIKVCHGTDYSECGPIRGIIKGIGDQTTKYAVKVIQQ